MNTPIRRREDEQQLRYREPDSVPVCAVREFRGRAVTSRVCVAPPASECVCLSVRGSVPLKQSSAQYDPCLAASVCVKQRKNGARRGEIQRAERSGAVAAARLKGGHQTE